MDLSLLTTLWNKINKPISNILVGCSIILFAPGDYQWVGYIFLAIGISTPIEWIFSQLLLAIKNKLKNKNIREKIHLLNRGEKQLIGKLIKENCQSFSVKDKNYHCLSQGGGGGRTDLRELRDISVTLASKGILQNDSESKVPNPCYSVPNNVWKIANKLYKKNPKIFELTLYVKKNENINIVVK